MKKRILTMILVIGMVSTLLGGCLNKKVDDGIRIDKEEDREDTQLANTSTEEKQEPVTILIAAAASMQNSLEEVIPIFQEKFPWVTIEGTYDSSGKLQIQIEEGLEADVFLSAAMKQMNTLKEESLVDKDSIVELLENKIVLIVPTGSQSILTSFDDVLNVDNIAIGDPKSVPAGQYAKEVFESIGIYTSVEKIASFGTNVTQVLNWVAEGSADAGVVYATDAATTHKITVIDEAPEGTLGQPVIYPVGIVSDSKKKEAAKLYIEFLQSKEVRSIFEKYGFKVK